MSSEQRRGVLFAVLLVVIIRCDLAAFVFTLDDATFSYSTYEYTLRVLASLLLLVGVATIGVLLVLVVQRGL
jgi:hypothetical protein